MSAALAHRGPDDEGTATLANPDAPPAHFAHRRLAVIDVSPAGHQPMLSDDGRYAIVFNGEIYNYRELRDDLQRDGRPFRTQTDTEVLLRLFERCGTDCLVKLRGMFAFAIHDSATGEVCGARDRVGIKPFYYHADRNGFLFASEIRALLASGCVRRTLDPVSVDAYLSFGAIQEPRTVLEGVRSLPPAHFIKVDGSGRVLRLARYWRLNPHLRPLSPAEAAVETRKRLDEGVRAQMVSDVPLGAFLSGGMDSGAIVALMDRHAAGRVHTFNVAFEHEAYDERSLARRVAKRWNTTHTEICLTEAEALASLPSAVAAIDQPTLDGVNTWFVARATRQAGATVALSGIGGDELFGGYPSFSRVPAVLKYAAPLRSVPSSLRFRAGGMVESVMGHTVTSQKLGAAVSGGAKLLPAYLATRGVFSHRSRKALLNGHGAGIDDAYALPTESSALLDGVQDTDVFNGVAACELQLYAGNMLLRDTDVASMAHALEVRVPLLDERLVELMFQLPGSAKLGPRRKNLLADALGGDLLPESVSGQKKGFTLPFDHWLRAGLKPFVSDVIADESGIRAAGLQPTVVAQEWKRFLQGSPTTSWSRVWSLVVLVDWCKRHNVSA